jgi:short-subunit dehydrogenase
MRTLITGASSGIGLALAQELARRGHALALLARRTELLDTLARELTSKGARAFAVVCDVTDAASVREAVRRSEELLGGPIDLAIANAGVSIPNTASKFKLADAEQVFRVNVFGMLYLFDAVIPSMIERASGRFAGVASVAGLRALPAAASYSASKAAMQNFLEASRVELVPHGVGVTIVNPGFVDTAMTAKNRFKMPFIMTAERAAKIIADGLDKGKRVIEFPFRTSRLMRALRLLPDALFDRMMVPYAQRRVNR